MAAPTYTARSTPGGISLKEGFKSVITLAAKADMELWEEEVTPHGIDGGEPINITTMHNTLWRTKAPPKLLMATDITFTCLYDPVFYTTAQTLINIPTTISTTLPDGTTIAEYGYMKSWVPGPLQIGQAPKATVTLVITNYDHVNKVEAGPTIANVAGT